MHYRTSSSVQFSRLLLTINLFLLFPCRYSPPLTKSELKARGASSSLRIQKHSSLTETSGPIKGDHLALKECNRYYLILKSCPLLNETSLSSFKKWCSFVSVFLLNGMLVSEFALIGIVWIFKKKTAKDLLTSFKISDQSRLLVWAALNSIPKISFSTKK